MVLFLPLLGVTSWGGIGGERWGLTVEDCERVADSVWAGWGCMAIGSIAGRYGIGRTEGRREGAWDRSRWLRDRFLGRSRCSGMVRMEMVLTATEMATRTASMVRMRLTGCAEYGCGLIWAGLERHELRS